MITDLSLNQDFTCILVSTNYDHKIFNCDPFGEFYVLSTNENDKCATAMVRMLFSTSLMIVVPQGDRFIDGRVLRVFNLKKLMKICELTFPLRIIDVTLNRKRLIVFLEMGQIYIHDLSSIRLIKVLEVKSYVSADENAFPRVVADLSSDDNSYLVLPVLILTELSDLLNADGLDPGMPTGENGLIRPAALLDPYIEFTHKNRESVLLKKSPITLSDLQTDSKGWVLVYDAINLKPAVIYKAHDSAIANLAISSEGSLVATASVKGTIVRVSHLQKASETAQKFQISKITNLRRGHNPASIIALRFNQDLTILGCGSENRTVHLFSLKASLEGKLKSGPAGSSGDSDEDLSADEAHSRLSSLEDLNDNLANLLVLKQPEEDKAEPKEDSGYYYSALRSSVKLLRNPYTKLLMKRLPYGDYLDNLIWEKPRRSFAFVKLPAGNVPRNSHRRVEIGFHSSGQLLLASYDTGMLYTYQIPEDGELKREECKLVLQERLV